MSTDSSLCVDFFFDPADGYGFEHFRSDGEDLGQWTVIGRFAALRFDTPLEAAHEAASRVEWLTAERRPERALEAWCERLATSGPTTVGYQL